MCTINRIVFLLIPFIISVAIISFAVTVNAASVMWNTTPNVELYHAHIQGGHAYMSNENITIQYNAQAVTDAGVVIPPGSTVSAGTRVTYEFIPHIFSDIYWFGTGNSYDSPYGSWMVGAADPGDRCDEKDFYSVSATNNGRYKLYAALSIDPPAKSLTSPCGVVGGGGSSTCTLNTPGEHSAQFNFVNTTGVFYASDVDSQKASAQCIYRGGMKLILDKKKYTCQNGNAVCAKFTFGDVYTLPVPQQTIDYPITVTEVVGQPPSAPSLLSSSGACVVGTPHTISMTSTDPDGDTIRYAVDWDANGTMDGDFIPTFGYVPSGTTRTADRLYSMAGSQTVKVRAQDSGGASSSWSTLTFSCTLPPASGAQCVDGTDNDGDGFVDLLDPNCTDSADLSEFSAPPPPPPPGPGPADLSIETDPFLLRRGETTQVTWSATNVTSCVVNGDNGDSWTGVFSPVAGKTSSPITKRVVYTLGCVDLNGNPAVKSAMVNIPPSWREH